MDHTSKNYFYGTRPPSPAIERPLDDEVSPTPISGLLDSEDPERRIQETGRSSAPSRRSDSAHDRLGSDEPSDSFVNVELPPKLVFLEDFPGIPSNLRSEREQQPVWGMYVGEADNFDASMTDEWKEGLDGLLIFAGLFSAVLTAFLTVSYPRMLPDNTQTTAGALVALSAQLSAIASSQPALPPYQSQVQPVPAYLLCINILWFLSLVLSLFASLSVLVVKQWIRAYIQGLYSTDAPWLRARQRQFRFDSASRWGVAEIIHALPVIIQLAVMLFLIGLTILLLNVHVALGGMMIGLMTLTILAYGVTAILPIFFVECPYKSVLSDAMSYNIRTVVAFMAAVQDVFARSRQVHTDLEAGGSSESFPLPLWRRVKFIRDQNPFEIPALYPPALKESSAAPSNIDTLAVSWLLSNSSNPGNKPGIALAFVGEDMSKEDWQNIRIPVSHAAAIAIARSFGCPPPHTPPSVKYAKLRAYIGWAAGLLSLMDTRALSSRDRDFLNRSLRANASALMDLAQGKATGGSKPAADQLCSCLVLLFITRCEGLRPVPDETQIRFLKQHCLNIILQSCEPSASETHLPSLFGTYLFLKYMTLQRADRSDPILLGLVQFALHTMDADEDIHPSLRSAVKKFLESVTGLLLQGKRKWVDIKPLVVQACTKKLGTSFAQSLPPYVPSPLTAATSALNRIAPPPPSASPSPTVSPSGQELQSNIPLAPLPERDTGPLSR